MSDKLREAAKDAVWHFNRMAFSGSYGFLKCMERIQAALADSESRTVDDVYYDVRHKPRPPQPTEEMEDALRKVRAALAAANIDLLGLGRWVCECGVSVRDTDKHRCELLEKPNE